MKNGFKMGFSGIIMIVLILSGCPTTDSDPPPIEALSISPEEETLNTFVDKEVNETPFTIGPSGAAGEFSSDPTLPNGLTIDPKTGKITGTPTEIPTVTSYTIIFTGSGVYKDKKVSARLNINVSVPNVTIVSDVSELIETINTTITPILYTKDPENATGTFSTNQNLPSGLSLDPNTGTISGTPDMISAMNTYEVIFTGSGLYVGKSSTQNLAIQVISVLSIEPNETVLKAVQNTAITPITFTRPIDAIGGTFSITPSANELPDGLIFNTVDGSISGTPTAIAHPKTYTITYSGTGVFNGKEASADVEIMVYKYYPGTRVELDDAIKAETGAGNTTDLNNIYTNAITEMSSLFKGQVTFNADI